MRTTELFAIFTFVKSLEHLYLFSEHTPSFLSSGVVSMPSWPPALLNITPCPEFTPSFPGSGVISVPSWHTALLNTIPYGVDTYVEVPILPAVVALVEADSPVTKTTIINAPTCIFHISQIARPRFSPAPVIPPRPQPICLNRQVHPQFEAPGPKSPRIIPSPFLLPSKSILPKPPFCFLSDETDIEYNNDDNDNNGSIWLSLLLSPTVLATLWHFCRLLARWSIRSLALHPEPVDNQGVEPVLWSQPNPVIPRCRKVECRDRVTQPRVFISTLPSLPAGFDALVIIPESPTASATISVPVLPSVSETKRSSTSPDRTKPPVTDLPLGIVPPTIDQAENITSICRLSSISPSSAEPPLKESVVQQSLPPPPTPTVPISLLPPLVLEESQYCWAPKPESATVAKVDAVESSPFLPTCENIIDASIASLPSITPTPAKKKHVPTQAPKHLRVPKTELPIEETATADLSIAEMQESCSQSTSTIIEAPLNLIPDWLFSVSEAAETTRENDVAPTTQTNLSHAQEQHSDELESTETATAISKAASLSDSLWAPEPSVIVTNEDVAPIVSFPPSKKAASGAQDSIWATAPDVFTSSQLTCESVSEALDASASTPLPVTTKRVRTKGPRHPLIRPVQHTVMLDIISPPVVDEVTTDAVETHLRPSCSLSEPIWVFNPTEATSENIVAPTPLLAEKAAGLQSSIWATVADVPEVVVLPATSSTPPPRATTPDVPEVITPQMTLPTPPPSAKKVSGLKASIWADDSSDVSTPSTTVPICEQILLACEQRNGSVSASRWANVPDAPRTPPSSARKVNTNRWKERRGRPFCA